MKYGQLANKIMKAEIPKDLQTFNNIIDLNWAWIYQSVEKGVIVGWKQFECLQCMVIESKFQKWLKDKCTSVILKLGTINFERMAAESIGSDGTIIRSLKI